MQRNSGIQAAEDRRPPGFPEDGICRLASRRVHGKYSPSTRETAVDREKARLWRKQKGKGWDLDHMGWPAFS